MSHRVSDVPPPPRHVAVRIYKSRTSSRRSSLASSARSAHGGPFSTHVAQHLRRASILETRKAKAADRNAHAEQVRLRAALNKAAPRVSDSEEKANAAQQARERYLAQVRANCAAEVRRSKRVAEEQREKRAAEHLRLKTILHDRHAQAERRRTQSRTKSTPKRAYVWKPRNTVEAAVSLQRAWRKLRRQTACKAFFDLQLSVETVQKSTFDNVAVRLSDDSVVACTMRFLQVYGLLHTPSVPAVRTFLSSFLILGHPAQVLNGDGDLEKDLMDRAERLLHCLFHHADDANIILAHSEYVAAFEVWRSKDSSFMIRNMVAQFVELDAIWQSVKDDQVGMVAADYKEGIQHNQALVLAKLKKLAGPQRALTLVREAVRKNRTKKPAPVKTKPRVVVDELVTAKTNSEDARQTFNSPLPENRQIIHELAIDREWRVNIEQRESERDTIIDELATKLQQGLDDGLENIWIPALAESIQGKLCSMLSPSGSFQVMVRETLDPALIAQQVAQKAFSYQKFFAFMDSILPKLCAPVRDEEVRRLASHPSPDPVHQLARICFILDLLMLDMLNFQLMTVAPALLKESASYESQAFAQQLKNAPLTQAIAWWQRAQDSVRCTEIRPSSAQTYMQGLIDLVLVSDMPSPEMLQLDEARFDRIHDDLVRIAAVSAILLNAKNSLRRDTRSLWKTEAQRMWELPYTSAAAAYTTIVESRYALPANTKQQLTTFVGRVISEAQNKKRRSETGLSHPVMKVLMKKLRQHLLLRLSASSAEERIRTTNSAAEILGASGMLESVPRIALIVKELQRIAHVDREAHAQWWDQIMQSL